MRTLLGLAFAWLAMGASPPPHTASIVASVDTVRLNKHLDTLLVNKSFKLIATTVDSAGNVMKSGAVTWIARDSSLFAGLKQSGTGNHTLKSSTLADTGRSYIVATSGAKKDSALIIIAGSIGCQVTNLGAVGLYPDSMVMRRTDSVGVVAIPRNECGGFLAKNLTWSSSDSTKATVTRLDSMVANVQALDSGVATVYIKAVSGSVRDSVKVKLKHAP